LGTAGVTVVKLNPEKLDDSVSEWILMVGLGHS